MPQGERLEYHEYIGLLKQSKIVVSPWGWGEWSHKDFEILMAGCAACLVAAAAFSSVLPAAGILTCIRCRSDLSPLPFYRCAAALPARCSVS